MLLPKDVPPQLGSTLGYARAVESGLNEALQVADASVRAAQAKQAELYDRGRAPLELELGSLVWVTDPAVPRGASPKLHPRYKGPYRVLRRLGEVNYEIGSLTDPRDVLTVHVIRLKPYVARSVQHAPFDSEQRSSVVSGPGNGVSQGDAWSDASSPDVVPQVPSAERAVVGDFVAWAFKDRSTYHFAIGRVRSLPVGRTSFSADGHDTDQEAACDWFERDFDGVYRRSNSSDLVALSAALSKVSVEVVSENAVRIDALERARLEQLLAALAGIRRRRV